MTPWNKKVTAQSTVYYARYTRLKRVERVAQASAPGSCKLQCPLVTDGDVISGHYCYENRKQTRVGGNLNVSYFAPGESISQGGGSWQGAIPFRDTGQTDARCRRSSDVRTELAGRAFSVAGPTVFNSLPPKIRLSHSRDIFERIAITHLLRRPVRRQAHLYPETL